VAFFSYSSLEAAFFFPKTNLDSLSFPWYGFGVFARPPFLSLFSRRDSSLIVSGSDFFFPGLRLISQTERNCFPLSLIALVVFFRSSCVIVDTCFKCE